MQTAASSTTALSATAKSATATVAAATSSSKKVLLKKATATAATAAKAQGPEVAVGLVEQIVADLEKEQADAKKANDEEVKKFAEQLLEMKKEMDLKFETVTELSVRKGKMEVKRDISEDDKTTS